VKSLAMTNTAMAIAPSATIVRRSSPAIRGSRYRVAGVAGYLIHHHPAICADPYAFRPERFLDEQPGPIPGSRSAAAAAAWARASRCWR
jgi:hypothetical protein